MKIFVLFCSMIFLYMLAFSQETGKYTDTRDGKVYKTIKIGNQIWMSENLAFKPDKGNYWAYNNDTNYLAVYGYLYDYETAKQIVPTGWHLPAIEEWITLYNFLGGKNNYSREETITIKLKDKKVYKALIEGGKSGFNVFLGGCRTQSGKFENKGSSTSFWSSSVCKENEIVWDFECIIFHNVDNICTAELNLDFPDSGKSIRCIKD